jgi:hypothetical protein
MRSAHGSTVIWASAMSQALITAIRKDTRVSLSDDAIIGTICGAIDGGLDAAA